MASTAKGQAVTGVKEPMAELTRIVGDPVHDMIAFRRTVPTFANDASDIIFDHLDMVPH